MITLGQKNISYQDLPDRLKKALKGIGELFAEKNTELILFGSFSTSTAMSYSDLDIAYKSTTDLSRNLKRELYQELENMPTIRPFDLVDYQTASNELKQNIDNDGIQLTKIS